MNLIGAVSGPTAVGKFEMIRVMNKEAPSVTFGLRLTLLSNADLEPWLRAKLGTLPASTERLQALKSDQNWVVYNSGPDTMEALDMRELIRLADEAGGPVILRVSPALGAKLSGVASPYRERIRTIFISPVAEKMVGDILINQGLGGVRSFLHRRTQGELLAEQVRDGGDINSPRVLAEIQKFARRAYWDMQLAPWFDYTLINRDGPANKNWEDPVSGDARQMVDDILAIVNGGAPRHCYKWPRDLLPEPEGMIDPT